MGQPFVNQRWLGGLLTNTSTIAKRLARMKGSRLDYETRPRRASPESCCSKREARQFAQSLGGIRNLSRPVGLLGRRRQRNTSPSMRPEARHR
ncbi:30S ribosomal protein S2 [Microbacterium sp.]|uniref:30S ribosomal protein S2 n=1 Tax=Microbacterium sp. TaxID=51671 RepID=UPI003A930974